MSVFNSETGASAIKNPGLGADWFRHALMFFIRPDYDLQSALEDSFAIMPTAGMIFGKIPEFSKVVNAIEKLEKKINSTNH